MNATSHPGAAEFRDDWRRGAEKVVVHYHIFKNAGTSVDAMLSRVFPSWRDWHAGVTTWPGPDDLAAELARRPVEAISCHTLSPPAPMGWDVFPIVLLRHPLDRALSVYLHERRCAPNTLSCHVARARDFGAYVRWCLDYPSAGGIVICNYQTLHLAAAAWRGHVYNARAGDAERDEALRRLSTLPAPGVVDRFDRFTERLAAELARWRDQPIDLPRSAWENRSGERTDALEARLRDLEGQLEKTLLQRFNDANTHDYALYERAQTLSP